MDRRRTLGIVVLTAALLIASMSLQTGQVFATAGKPNAVANPGFENPGSTSWFITSIGDGTVKIFDTTHPHSGAYSAMLNATLTAQTCAPCPKDSVRATANQNIYAPPTLDKLANANDSLSAWWYVADPSPIGLSGTYSLHIGIGFIDPQASYTIEYWYGISDLSNLPTTHNLGPIPTAAWFQMKRNLLTDLQGVIPNPSTARISNLWFSAYGDKTHGEIAWVDDAALSFNGGPAAVFSSRPASGPAPLTVNFDASQSVEIGGLGSILNYSWSFGDGSSSPSSESSAISHTYGGPGDFTVTLTITDSSGVIASSSSMVKVGPTDLTIALIVGGGGGLLLMGGLFFTRFRRKPTIKRAKPKLRKG